MLRYIFIAFSILFCFVACDNGKKAMEEKIAFYKSQPRDPRVIGTWISGCEKKDGKFYMLPSRLHPTLCIDKATGVTEIYTTPEIDPQTGALTGGKGTEKSLVSYFYTKNNKLYTMRTYFEGRWGTSEYVMPYYEIKGDTLWTYESLPIETAIKHYSLKWTGAASKRRSGGVERMYH